MDFLPVPRGRLWKSKTDFFRPFRNAVVEAGENIVPLYDPDIHRSEVESLDLKDLNTALAALVEVFPDVQPEVLREMLVSVNDESRLQLVTEHLLKKKSKWNRGRVRTAYDSTTALPKKQKAANQADRAETDLTVEQSFRSDTYKKAVKQVFYQEFKSLSHSSIRAVLAEQNFSYALSRPILQQLSSKSWRFSFTSVWPRKSTMAAAGEHPYIVWQVEPAGKVQTTPAVRRTGSSQLDQELHDLFVVPIVEDQRKTLLAADYALAYTLNETEATGAEALFDCECCYDSIVFEQLSTCDDGCHQLCFNCVRRTVNEALFGQGWSRIIDLERSTVRCFASTAQECRGAISGSVLQRALASGADNEELWIELQQRVTIEVVGKSRLPVQRCPFCFYVEIDETPAPRRRGAAAIVRHAVKRTPPKYRLLMLVSIAMILLFLIPVLVFVSYAWLAFRIYSPATSTFEASWKRIYKQRSGIKFTCRGPACGRTSCIRCLAVWRDPHSCFENEKTSLRTAIEASATAAIKRTCPKCLLSFVKSTGCNKLVCNCGYTMCYICRQEITNKEGYSHFCQHFRPHGGRCIECEKCDLYGDEDEESAIRNAAATAEKAWKEKKGGGEKADEKSAQLMVEAVVGRQKKLEMWEVWLDFVVDAVVA